MEKSSFQPYFLTIWLKSEPLFHPNAVFGHRFAGFYAEDIEASTYGQQDHGAVAIPGFEPDAVKTLPARPFLLGICQGIGYALTAPGRQYASHPGIEEAASLIAHLETDGLAAGLGYENPVQLSGQPAVVDAGGIGIIKFRDLPGKGDRCRYVAGPDGNGGLHGKSISIHTGQ